MFKKLDKLIIRAFIGPFIATFFITLLVLVIQFFWLYIDDFVGKGLGVSVVLEFILYQSATLVPLALPLAILLSSLMTFGNLGEHFELVAIKSAGISLLRFMRPLFFVSLFICGIAFMFSNYIIPVANLKSRTLLSDIVFAKPAFDLKEGVFYDKITGFAIKLGKKESNDSVIRDVIIYEQGNPLQDNFIIAKSGIMRMGTNKRFLELDLKDGWRYQEKAGTDSKTEYIRVRFSEYKKQFDLSSFQFNRTADSVNKTNALMYSMRQLEIAIDSMKKDNSRLQQQMEKDIFNSISFIKNLDSPGDASTPQLQGANQPRPADGRKEIAGFDELIPDSIRLDVNRRAMGQASSLKVGVESLAGILKEKEKVLLKHRIEWHRKISLSLTCLVLFLVGAPLGSIIRKGGLGIPLVFAITFFMIFFFSSTTGEKFAKANALSPFAGMWLAIIILLPVGLFLTYKAMKDSHLLNKEFYYRFTKSITRFFVNKKSERRKVGKT